MSRDNAYAPLLAILRSQPDLPDPALPDVLDWDSLIVSAASVEILPLLYLHAQHLPVTLQPPAAIQQRLHIAYLHAAAHNFRMFYERDAVLSAFYQADIRLIPLKGSHLLSLVYPDPAIRVMGDVDLLVHREDLPRGRAVLAALGYEPYGSSLVNDPHAHHEKFVHDSAAPVELHWSLGLRDDQRARPVDSDALWARAQAAELGGVPVQVLESTDLFIYLCLHNYFHGFHVGLRRLLDLVLLVQKHPEAVHPDRLWPRAAAWRVVRPVALMVEVLRDWFHVVGPPIPITRDDAFVAALDRVKDRILTPETEGTPPHMSRLFGPQHWHEKARVAFRQLFPSRAKMAERYGCPAASPRIMGFYCVRVGHALGSYFNLAFHRNAQAQTLREQGDFLDWVDVE